MNKISTRRLIFVLLFITPLFTTVFISKIAIANADLTNGLPICTAENHQYSPQLCLAQDGMYAYITWVDNRSGTNYDIYAQEVFLDGVLYHSNIPVATTPLMEYAPQLCESEYDVSITWSVEVDLTNYDVYAKAFDTIPLPTVSICTEINYQSQSEICPDGIGGVIIAWKDQRAGGWADVYAQRVNTNGFNYWPYNGREVSTANNNQKNLKMCSDSAGGAIIVWEDDRGGVQDNIYVQRINSSGFQQWVHDGTAVCTASGWQADPQICTDGAEGAILAWRDARTGADYDIYAQSVNSTGDEQWISNGIAICTATNDQYIPHICSDGTGGAIIAWADQRGGGDIYAQKINSNGNTHWNPNGTAICTADRYQSLSQICSDGAGGAIITWQDRRKQTDYDIYAQRIDSSGNVKWASNGIGICTADGDQRDPQICSDGEGGAIITWWDGRNETSYDIYAERVNSNGVRLWSTLENGKIQFGNYYVLFIVISVISLIIIIKRRLSEK
jgi:hypothetical protein